MSFSFDNNIPIYIQLVEQLKINIISGKIKPGERLPSIRDLAMDNKVNPNTMQKALAELEEMKLIYTERTNGKYITNDNSLISKYKEEYAKKISVKYISDMKVIGYDDKQILEHLKQKGGNK